ncbi:hypothetical protein EV44_g4245 [Erysiphe necator]|uniref:Uncharacterized protein n=1 Tax=Uncinula necator TaxID=52586 RepID=A0A0B1PD45_UNCNE|nr:hypothetical protein EV44_g4245 [Erysiphe necator]
MNIKIPPNKALPQILEVPPPPLNVNLSAQKGGGESLTEILMSTTSAAEKRTQEAKLIFQKIATILDEARDKIELPEQLQKPYRDFIANLNIVARRHFERHVKDTPRPPPPYATSSIKQTSSIPAIPLNKTVLVAPPKKSTYAAVTKAPAPRIQQDNRLFVRVPPGHTALKMSPYAVMLDLNSFLKETLIREIQVIKTGFAICPTSITARDILYSRTEEIEAYLSTQGQCKVEKPTKPKAYLLSGIPPS